MTGSQAEVLAKFAGPDLTERVKSLSVALTANVQSEITVGGGYKGVRFTTALTDCYVSIDSDIPDDGVRQSATGTISEDDFYTGNLLSGTEREVRIIPLGMKPYVINLKAATSGTVLVELF